MKRRMWYLDPPLCPKCYTDKAEAATALTEVAAAAALGLPPMKKPQHVITTFIGPVPTDTVPLDPSLRMIFKCKGTGKFSMQGVLDGPMPHLSHPSASRKVYVCQACSTQSGDTFMVGTHAWVYHLNLRLECPGCDFQTNSGWTMWDHIHKIHAAGSKIPLKQ